MAKKKRIRKSDPLDNTLRNIGNRLRRADREGSVRGKTYRAEVEHLFGDRILPSGNISRSGISDPNVRALLEKRVAELEATGTGTQKQWQGIVTRTKEEAVRAYADMYEKTVDLTDEELEQIVAQIKTRHEDIDYYLILMAVDAELQETGKDRLDDFIIRAVNYMFEVSSIKEQRERAYRNFKRRRRTNRRR